MKKIVDDSIEKHLFIPPHPTPFGCASLIGVRKKPGEPGVLTPWSLCISEPVTNFLVFLIPSSFSRSQAGAWEREMPGPSLARLA